MTPTAAPNPSVSKETRNILGAIETFREAVPLDSISYFRAFLVVMENDGIERRELASRMPDIATASNFSKILKKLAKYPGVEGYDLVIVKANSQDLRLKRIYLTDKGKRLAQKIAAHLT
jgi:DNA-binding MarR family transcriptional regulator